MMNEDLLLLLCNGLALGMLTSLVACGHSLLYREYGALCLGFAALPSVAAMLGNTAIIWLQGPLAGLPSYAMLLLVLAASWAAAALMLALYERHFWQHMRRATPVAQLLAGLVIAITVLVIAARVWDEQMLPASLPDRDFIDLGGAVLPLPQVAIVAMGMLLICQCLHYFPATTASGTSATKRQRTALLWAGLLGAASGVGAALLFGAARPAALSIGAAPLVAPLVAALAGGLGNVKGGAVAGLALGLLGAGYATYMAELSGGALNSETRDIMMLVLLALAWRARRWWPRLAAAPMHGAALPVAVPSDTPDSHARTFAIIAVLILFSTVLDVLLPFSLLASLRRSVPLIVIAIGLYCAVGRAQLPALGYLIYPATGACVYAMLSGADGMAQLPPWLLLVAGGAVAATLAALLYFWARTLQAEACAIVSLAVYAAAMPCIEQLDDPAYPGGTALTKLLIRPLVETTSSTTFLVGMLVVAAASGLLYLIHKMAPASRAGNHVAAGLIGGVGGALLVATQASYAPQYFSMYPYIVLFAMVLVLKRFGLWCIIAGAVLLASVQTVLSGWQWLNPTLCVLALSIASRLPERMPLLHGMAYTPFGPNRYRLE
ncbi:hypothetical protein O0882_11405 [Janthinobacterium sp. SUN073]|uniref:hypothetical protein n=1 Tax=Janthinobacterium sp. SUN073 TaxID=3004102 RepID=UPI0025B0FBA4|nr:hypothetical protein [Janthinobacterium sp. SUN073]MDN2696925.1 hypothetical protein [Janthinobacterium sp. SUN073]